ncbi:hypothetical protein BASA62_006629, partial [Batrachochytrium salamandrivorans]
FDKYPNSVDNTLAFGLEARSYQPGLNSYKELATSTLLKRRGDSLELPGDNSEGSVGDNSEGSTGDNSEGSVGDNSEGSTGDNSEGTSEDNSEGSTGDNSGSDSSPPPDTTPNEPFIDPFTDGMTISKNIASTIRNVGDGVAGLFTKGELAIQKFGGDVRDMVARHLRRHAYVNAALAIWIHFSLTNSLLTIQSLWGDNKFSEIGPELVAKIEKLKAKFSAESKVAVDTTSKILNDDGLATDNLHNIDESFQNALDTCMSIVAELKSQLVEFDDDRETRSGYSTDILASIFYFYFEQQESYSKIAKKLGIASSQ